MTGTLRRHGSGLTKQRKEGDLITGAFNTTAIGTLVERTSGYLRLVHLPATHTAQVVCPAVAAVIAPLPTLMRRSLTWDQGSELSEHAIITAVMDHGVFFAHPGSPWQRGSNENTYWFRMSGSGRLRREPL